MRMSERGLPITITALNTDGNFSTTTDGVNMKNYNRCMIVYQFTCDGVSNATVTTKQGTSATADTALAFTEYSKNEDCLTYPTTFTKVTASTLTTAGPASGTCCYIFEIKATQLDTDTFGSENTYIRLDAESSANVTAACLTYYLYEPQEAKSTDGMPSVS